MMTPEELEELINEYGNAAANYTEAYHWGVGVPQAHKEKQEAREALLAAYRDQAARLANLEAVKVALTNSAERNAEIAKEAVEGYDEMEDELTQQATLYASSQAHVAELLADNASLRAKIDTLNEILNHIGQRLNIDIDPEVLESELDEIADQAARLAKLEQALNVFADGYNWIKDIGTNWLWVWYGEPDDPAELARAALEGEE